MRGSDIKVCILPLAAAVLLTACATTIGTQFARPPADFVRLGETTRAQIVGRLGKPQDEGQMRSDGQQLRMIGYYFGSETEAPKDFGTVCARTLTYVVLSDEIVIGEAFTSSCAADHTDFDERKAGDIVKGKTRCDDAFAMMGGRPNTRGIYPIVEKKGDLTISYLFKSGRRGGAAYSKELAILCDSDGIVREMAFRESGRR